MITDKLKSYGAARKDMGLKIEHRQHKGLNNRAENSHLPTRRRERIMKRVKSPRQVQRFFSIYDQVANLFHFPRNRLSATAHRNARVAAFTAWAKSRPLASPHDLGALRDPLLCAIRPVNLTVPVDQS